MTTATYLKLCRLLSLIERVMLKRGVLFHSRRYTPQLSAIYLEQEARLRRYLLETVDRESRRAA